MTHSSSGRGRLAAGALAVLAACATAHAADRPLDARKLVLKRSAFGSERLVFVAKDAGFLFPTIGSGDDPAGGDPGGLTIDLFSGNDPAGASLAVPPGVGKPGWRVQDGTAGLYKFVNPAAPAGPSVVKAVVLKEGRLVKISARATGLALLGAQGTVGIRLTTGSLRNCAFFGPETVRRDETGRFVAKNALATAVPDCSDASLGGAAGTTTTSVPGATTTTSVPGGTTTTTSTLPAGTVLLDFTTTAGAGPCGASRDADANVIRELSCGGLNLGGGEATVPEGIIPDGATSRFEVVGCAGTACELAPAAGGGPGVDCTDAGCRFGPPLPIPNGGLSTCVVNTFEAGGSGTVDTATGEVALGVPLEASVFVTGNGAQPCPRCSAAGGPGNPGTGTCDRGANAGGACSSTNSLGLSGGCPPGGADGSTFLGGIPVDLTPLTTETVTASAADGLFCPEQVAGDNAGCFASTACRSFEEVGLPGGPLVPGMAQPASLASTFCIPGTGNIVIDGAAGLPGPGAASLPGILALTEIVGTTTSTTSSTSTSVPGSSSTSTTTSTSSSTTTTSLLPLPPLTVEFASLGGSGTCGAVRDGAGIVVGDLDCGDLSLGGGATTLPPSVLPDGAVNRFTLGGCGLTLACGLGATTTAGPDFDCTDTGCFFGPPVPIPNGSLSACSVSTFAAPATGTVNLLTGATTANVSLSLGLWVTGNAAQPCPACSATGAPGAPGSGTCDRGANAGGPCTSLNSLGLSKDCQPGGADGSVDLGAILANLSPVTTGTASLSNPVGIFCPGQANAGCFGEPACRSIEATGAAPVALLSSALPQPSTLVSTFCVPATGNVLLDGSADLPGPAAISLPGQVRSSL